MPQKARILLVDDRAENLIALEAILSSLNQQLVPVRSGEAALKALLSDVVEWPGAAAGGERPSAIASKKPSESGKPGS